MTSQLWSVGATAGNANADLLITGSKPLNLVFCQVTFTASAGVFNRLVRLRLLDPAAATVLDIISGVAITASLANQLITFAPAINRETSLTQGSAQVPIPLNTVVLPGWTLRLSATNGQAGDSFTAKGLLLSI